MMMLSEKTAYKAVAFAARHKWAKPFCFGVYSAVYAAEKLKADEKPFSRRLIAFATASAFVFMTVPTSYAAALTQPETSVVTEQMNTMEPVAMSPEDIAARVTLEGLAENEASYGLTLNIRSLRTDITARFTSSDQMESDIKAAFEGYGIDSDELCISPVKIQLYRNDTKEKLQISEGYSADVTLPVPEEMLSRIDELRGVRLEDNGTLTVIEGETDENTFSFRTNKLGSFALVTYKDTAEDIGSGAGVSDTGIVTDISISVPQPITDEDKRRFRRNRGKKRIYRIKRIVKENERLI